MRVEHLEKLEEKMIQNMPVRKPEVKKKDKFDPLKLAELIDKQKDTKIDNPKDIVEKDYEALDSTPSLDKRLIFRDVLSAHQQLLEDHIPLFPNHQMSSIY